MAAAADFACCSPSEPLIHSGITQTFTLKSPWIARGTSAILACGGSKGDEGRSFFL